MITRVEVDGFKSLGQFELDIFPGLNVIIGPNGSGKTNIVQFFEFLAQVVRSDLSEAVGKSGGAGTLFRRSGRQEFQKYIKATVYGCVQISQKKYLSYRYSFEIRLPTTNESLVYRNQSITVFRTQVFATPAQHDARRGSYHLDVEQECDGPVNPRIRVKAADPGLFPTPLFSRDEKVKVRGKFRRIEQALQRFITPQQNLISTFFRFTFDLMQINQDLASGDTYNIIPSRVKQPEDCAKRPGIEKDGSGLAATLYGIRRGRFSSEQHGFIFARPQRHLSNRDLSLESVTRYATLANESIKLIDVVSDPYSSQLNVTLLIESGQYSAVLPLSSMSDGTVKWIALTAAILTAPSIFSLEEPENYLHPLMQSQIVTIMREILLKRKQHAFTIMTTHSETILNSCRPDEIVVVSMCDGATVARRCTNAETLKEEIDKTGFGLGYYYLAGAVSDE